MKRLIPFVFMLLAGIIPVSAQQTARVESKEFDSKYFPFKRPFFILTPEEYDQNVNSNYDVIYVFDAQYYSRVGLVHNLLHYGCQELATPNDDANQYIVVGVPSPLYIPEYNFERNCDFYSIPVNTPMPEGRSEEFFGAPKFKKFLKEERPNCG